jgi:hypothetical protein
MGILDMWKAVRGQTAYPSGKDPGVLALDVELKCLDASERIRAFDDPQERDEAREDYARLVSDAVREAFAIEQEADRDTAFRYIIDVSCNAKDFRTAEAVLTKIVSEENRQSASRAVAEARLQNTPQ